MQSSEGGCGLRRKGPFNSLFEMRGSCTPAGPAAPRRAFNSLFEMPG